MITVSQQRIDSVFRRTQFHPRTIGKTLYLMEFLRAFFRDTALSKHFALIGGAALHLSRRDTPRLSEDIDLDFIGDPELGIRDDSLKALKQAHLKQIQALTAGIGWKMRLCPSRSGRRDATVYVLPEPGSQIELNLSYRYCHSITPTVYRRFGPLEGDTSLSPFRVRSLRKDELWASKLVACIQDRPPDQLDLLREPRPKVKARHIYDVYWLTKHLDDVDLELLRKFFFLFGVSRIKDFSWCRGEVIRFSKPADVERYIFPMLRATERVPELRSVAWNVRCFLDEAIYAKIRPEEYEFMKAWEKGAFNPFALFPQHPKIAARLQVIRYYEELLGTLVSVAKHPKPNQSRNHVNKRQPGTATSMKEQRLHIRLAPEDQRNIESMSQLFRQSHADLARNALFLAYRFFRNPFVIAIGSRTDRLSGFRSSTTPVRHNGDEILQFTLTGQIRHCLDFLIGDRHFGSSVPEIISRSLALYANVGQKCALGWRCCEEHPDGTLTPLIFDDIKIPLQRRDFQAWFNTKPTNPRLFKRDRLADPS